jgi:RimJ/RimL family protein N-acetyltransferase
MGPMQAKNLGAKGVQKMLRGERVVLRPIEPPHLPNYVRWLSDTEVLEWFGMYRPGNLAQEQSWYEAQNKDDSTVNFAVELHGRHIGGAGFGGIDHANQHAEVGLFIGEKTLWDQGLGKDTLRTIVAYGFDYLNLHRIYLRVYAENHRAIRAYEQVGFTQEGRFREAYWRHGRWQDMLYMSILRPEWESRKS